VNWLDWLREAHRRLELLLDELLEASAAGTVVPAGCHAARREATALYAAESTFLDALNHHSPSVAVKLAGQQAEVLELAAALAESLAAGHHPDSLQLVRRFCALAQHTIIEEERDVFPLARRWFTPEQQARLPELLQARYDQKI
jgi:hypothetical protein